MKLMSVYIDFSEMYKMEMYTNCGDFIRQLIEDHFSEWNPYVREWNSNSASNKADSRNAWKTTQRPCSLNIGPMHAMASSYGKNAW